MAAALPKTCVKKDGGVEFPSVVNLYDFFAPRTKEITIWSFGFRNGEFECDIAESTGAKVHIFDARQGKKERYEIYNRVMNTHETDPSDPDWAKDLTEYWILPDSTSFHSVLPGLYNGSLDLSGTLTQFSAFTAERVDLVKVDYGEHTPFIVVSLLQHGYRPGLLWVNWNEHPDFSNLTMSVAGNIQTLGYRLLKAEGNYFVYMFVDDCMYELCSWARTDCSNPMFLEFKDQLFNELMVKSVATENQKKE